MNKATKKTAPPEALDQAGTVMPRIIEVLATAPLSEYPINFSKLDIKYGFWIMVYAVGQEWNFAYFLLKNPEAPNKFIIPSAI